MNNVPLSEDCKSNPRATQHNGKALMAEWEKVWHCLPVNVWCDVMETIRTGFAWHVRFFWCSGICNQTPKRLWLEHSRSSHFAIFACKRLVPSFVVLFLIESIKLEKNSRENLACKLEANSIKKKDFQDFHVSLWHWERMFQWFLSAKKTGTEMVSGRSSECWTPCWLMNIELDFHWRHRCGKFWKEGGKISNFDCDADELLWLLKLLLLCWWISELMFSLVDLHRFLLSFS